ncbi:MAG: superoxide dismutase [Rhodospirillaceae bacterium]|nr:superoxide dismutase [Rhodospirillaceae bacterium]
MPVVLPKLPYALDALEPHVSARTLEFHHGKHHKAYVDKTNELIAGTDLEKSDLEEIIRRSAADASKKTLFNQSAQVWNHTFFWNSMKPKGGGQPTGDVAKRIESDLGGYDKFAQAFKAAAAGQFGSGWAWLVLDGGKLKVLSTANADTPLVHNQTPLLTLDVWEHAYYLDYQNRRPDFIAAFLGNLVNWDFVNENLTKASAAVGRAAQ